MLHKTEAIVIKSINSKDADKFLTLLTSRYGKVHAVAKGVRKTKSKFGSSMELFTHSKLLLYKKYNNKIYLVTQFEIINSFYGLKKDLRKYSAALYMAELIDKFTENEEASGELWMLLMTVLSFLKEIKSREEIELLLRFYEIRLITILGFKISLETCSKCSKQIFNSAQASYKFSADSGGIICKECLYTAYSNIMLSKESISLMRELQTIEFDMFNELRYTKQLLNEIKDALLSVLSYHADRKFSTLSFLKENL